MNERETLEKIHNNVGNDVLGQQLTNRLFTLIGREIGSNFTIEPVIRNGVIVAMAVNSSMTKIEEKGFK